MAFLTLILKLFHIEITEREFDSHFNEGTTVVDDYETSGGKGQSI